MRDAAVCSEAVERSGAIRETEVLVVGLVALLAVLVSMSIDHLLGNEGGGEDGGFVDPAMFGISVGVSLVVAAILFGWFVPRERRAGTERAARSGLVCSILSVVPGITLVWIGIPFVVAGAGVALGLDGRRGTRRVEAVVAIAVGALVLLLGTSGYVVAAAG